MTFLLILDVFLAIIGVYLFKKIFSPPPTTPYPPGPKGLPLLGNALDMPTFQEWKTYAQWGNRWGGIVYLNVLGQPFVIINSLQTAMEMLDKKSSIYSDRPILQFSSNIIGWINTLGLTPYGDRFREYRRMLHPVIGTKTSMEKFHVIEEQETHRFLRRVLQTPDEVAEHIRWTAGAIILRISYGYSVKDRDDPYITNADVAVDQFSKSIVPGTFLVDFIPWLNYVPEWFPGTKWKQTGKAWKKDLNTMADEPHDFVKKQMAAGTALPSFTATHLEQDLNPQQEFNVKWAAASLYSGGADTTVSAIYSFFLAMTLHPEVQRRAQAEIDAVVGHDRLPSFADREHLPYTEALVQEVFRWQPVAPMGLPHRLIQDDIHDGYFIRKGTIVLTNIWKFLHDEEAYPDPMTFNPERFLGPKPQMDPRTVCFGFGRRICIGLNLADASVFMSCAMALAMFDITKVVENGNVVEPAVEYTSGTISHPKPFKCSIKPRSEKAVELILSDGFFENT